MIPRIALVVLLALAAGCSRHRAHPVPVDAPAPPSLVDAPAPAPIAPAPIAPAPIAPAPIARAAATRIVTRIVDGQVVVDEVPLDANAPTAPPGPASATPALGTAVAPGTVVASATMPTGSARPAAAPPSWKAAQDLLARGAAEPDLEKRVEILEDGEKTLEKSCPPYDRSMVFEAIGEAYEAQNDGLHAIYAYESAADLNPRAAARLADLKKKQEVEKYFTHIQNRHFVAQFEGDDDKTLADGSLAILDDAWRSVGDALDLHPSSPVTVIFYTGERFQTILNAPDWTGGQFDGKIRVRKGSWRLAHGEVRDLLFHEYTHALVHTVKGGVPTWMNEGIAQHFETQQNRSTLNGLKQAGGRKRLPKLHDLRGGAFYGRDKSDAAGARISYACALDLVDLLAEMRGESSFKDLFAAINGGKSFDDAVADVYGVTQEQLESKWRDRFSD